MSDGPHRWQLVDTWSGGVDVREVVFTSTAEGDAGHTECFKWIADHTPYSFDEATKNQGYLVEPAELDLKPAALPPPPTPTL